MPRVNRKSKKSSGKRNRRRRGRANGSGYPVDPSVLTMSNTGGLIAPMATEFTRPEPFQRSKAPRTKGAEACLTGCDFVGTVSSLTTTQTVEYILNALNNTTFPRLCAAASIWRRYRFNKLCFHLFGIAAATQQGFGAFASIVTDDLGEEASVSGEKEILNMEGAAIVRPWSGVTHEVKCSAEGLRWYTCSATESATKFGEAIGRAFFYLPNTTSAGQIQVQIYVSYEVEFSQRVAYQTLVPTATEAFLEDTLDTTFDQVAGESSPAIAGDYIMESLQDALLTSEPYPGAYTYKALGEVLSNLDYTPALCSLLGPVLFSDSWEGSLSYILGEVFSTDFFTIALNYDSADVISTFTPMLINYLIGMDTNYSSYNWQAKCVRLAGAFCEAVNSAYPGSYALIVQSMKDAITAYVPAPDLKVPKPRDKGLVGCTSGLTRRCKSGSSSSKCRRSLNESRPRPSDGLLPKGCSSPSESSKRTSFVETVTESTSKIVTDDTPIAAELDSEACIEPRCSEHPDSREGIRIWCTLCQNKDRS